MDGIECPACQGNGSPCKHCTHGKFVPDKCPNRYVTSDIHQLIQLADLYRKGVPPVTGGTLNQTKIFNDACEFFWNECETIKSHELEKMRKK